ncbi:hypothetical protein A6770_34690 [Nostoc minutum NIES-26]|uniref:Uncharacterized protein n=1 Tax=Nostoc minutum NIES-26 TaxID=1844469 RepID=A0A367S0R1_9NOSO|nr:hypothetical protein A6770_34690 [Nostoc minutum NIES-26]
MEIKPLFEVQDQLGQSLIQFDEARTEFQTSQVVANRAIDQFKVFELRYVRGNSDTSSKGRKLKLDGQPNRSITALIINVQKAPEKPSFLTYLYSNHRPCSYT